MKCKSFKCAEHKADFLQSLRESCLNPNSFAHVCSEVWKFEQKIIALRITLKFNKVLGLFSKDLL